MAKSLLNIDLNSLISYKGINVFKIEINNESDYANYNFPIQTDIVIMLNVVAQTSNPTLAYQIGFVHNSPHLFYRYSWNGWTQWKKIALESI